MLTTTQVNDQKARFTSFLSSANLAKIGQRYLWFVGNNAEDGRYTPYCYLLRVLSLVANVGGCYSHPENLRESYRSILETEAVAAFLDTLPSK